MAVHADVLKEAPEWKPYKPVVSSRTRPDTKPAPDDDTLNKLLSAIDQHALPKGYDASKHQAYVDARMKTLSPQQRARIGGLWKEKRRLQPKMKNAGMSFVRILEYVAAGENKTRIHRLTTTRRSAFDAFAYVNRIPQKAFDDETPGDFAGRILGRLANQEGRILLKAPAGMDRRAYDGFKKFLSYEGSESVGNCAACHAPTDFTDGKSHIVRKGGTAKPTPSLRNLVKRKVDLRKAVQQKLEASKEKQSGQADDISDAYSAMKLNAKDVAGIVAFLKLLEDVPDDRFRKLILDAKVLDTSKVSEEP